MDVIQFQEKLRNICELGKQNGNMLTHEQIREHFASTDLETSQMLKVLQYLKLQGIMIEETLPRWRQRKWVRRNRSQKEPAPRLLQRKKHI